MGPLHRLLIRRFCTCTFALTIAAPTSAIGQTVAAERQSPPGAPAANETVTARPASSTLFGDTGLWFVPTADVLPEGRIAASGYRVTVGTNEELADISYLAGSVAVGIRDRLELFGSVRPHANRVATGAIRQPAGFGDIFAGAKVNLASEERQAPASFSVRGIVKVPTASYIEGLGTGDLDVMVDALLSRDVARRVGLASYAGIILRATGGPSQVKPGNAFRWGVGAAFPTRSSVRVSAELYGEKSFSPVGEFVPDSISVCYFWPEQCTGFALRNPLDAFLGLDYQHPSGLFVGAGIGFTFQSASAGRGGLEPPGEYFQVRFGYHPGIRGGATEQSK